MYYRLIMTSKTFKLILFVTVFVSGINFYISQRNVTIPDIVKANIEALADDESSWIFDCAANGCIFDFSYDCYYLAGAFWEYCPDMGGRNI